MVAGSRLDHLTGIRGLLALWIVCGHYMPRSDRFTFFEAAACRSFMAVDVFVVMSGFVTHWAYADRIRQGTLSTRSFYVRRMAHIILTTYIAMAVSLIVVAAVPKFRSSFMPDVWTLVSCVSFVAHWVRPAVWCPAPPSWTIEALIPCWLAYPFARRLTDRVDSYGGTSALILLLLALHAISFGPLVYLYFLQDGQLSWGQFATDFMWPPSQLADFTIGVVAALVTKKHENDLANLCWPGLLADVSCAGAVALVLCMPIPATHAECQRNENALLTHGFALALAAFMFGSSGRGGNGGLIARLLSHEALVVLGAYSFEVYLFQWPLVSVFHYFFQQWPLPSDAFIAYLLLLWILAGFYVEFLAPPMVRWLRSKSEEAVSNPAEA